MADEKKDLLQITGVTQYGDYSYVRQRPNDEMEVGLLRNPQEGKPMNSPLAMKAVNETGLYEVEELVSGTLAPSKGPAKVNSDEFRTGWDRIFGGPKTVGQA